MKKPLNCAIKKKPYENSCNRSATEWEINKEEHEVIVEDEDVATVVAKQTGIPLSRLTEGETQKVLKMEEILEKISSDKMKRLKRFAGLSAAAEPISKILIALSAPFFSWAYRRW